MIVAAAIASAQAAPLEVFVPVDSMDKGYFAGLKEGIFLPIEEHALAVTNCKRPHMPAALRSPMVTKMTSFWPMVKSMATMNNQGVEPRYLAAIEEIVERMVILVSMFGVYNETGYCFGAVYSYELKTIFLKIWEELVAYLPEGMVPDLTQLPPVKM